MDEVAQARAAVLEAIGDITPDRLKEVMTAHLRGASMIPGVLALLSASVAANNPDEPTVLNRAAGVQLIYDGLRLTRALVQEEPWAEGGGLEDEDLHVLAADVLVARGFHLLSHTEAADSAVETVRAFGREQTELRSGATTARSLEANVFELAVIAGATAPGGETPLPLRQYVVGLARNVGDPPLPSATEGLPEGIEEAMHRVGSRPTGEEPVRTPSATDP
ncbi:MAG: DUF7114 family protein [Halodesulfurarchaeum sp.]